MDSLVQSKAPHRRRLVDQVAHVLGKPPQKTLHNSAIYKDAVVVPVQRPYKGYVHAPRAAVHYAKEEGRQLVIWNKTAGEFRAYDLARVLEVAEEGSHGGFRVLVFPYSLGGVVGHG